MSGDTEREALAKLIYGAIAFQGGDPEHYEAVRDSIYHDAADAILANLLPDHDERVRAEAAERAWREGYYTGKRDYAGSITGGMPISTPNPYERRGS